MNSEQDYLNFDLMHEMKGLDIYHDNVNNQHVFNEIKRLVKLGADVNYYDKQIHQYNRNNYSIFMYACRTHYLNLIKFLVENGANVNYRDPYTGDTPLSVNIKNRNNIDTAKYLLEHGADPNIRNNNGLTSIFYANKPEMIKLLIQYGADPFITIKTTLNDYYKSHHRNKEVLEYLNTIQNLMLLGVPSKSRTKYSKSELSKLPTELHRNLTYTLHQFSKKSLRKKTFHKSKKLKKKSKRKI